MRIGKICGSVWATKKADELTGSKLLIVELLDKPKSRLVASDTIGAGVGDTVLVMIGSAVNQIYRLPTDAAICGIIDKIDIAGNEDGTNEY